MEGQRRFRGFRSRNGYKLPNLSPERATKEYKYGTSGPRQRRGEPGEGFSKKTARMSFSSTPNIRKLFECFCQLSTSILDFCLSNYVVAL